MSMSSAPDERPRVLIVDDEKFIRDILADFLGMEGYIVRTAEDGAAALNELGNAHYNLIISDLKMPRMGGIELLDAIGTAAPNALTVIMTGFGTVETAIDAMKRGAYDYILKPFKVEEVIRVVQRGLEKQRLSAENLRLREAVSLYTVSEAIAASLSLDEVLATIGDTAIHELKGDLVSTWLDDGEGGYFERQRLLQPRTSDSSVPPPHSARVSELPASGERHAIPLADAQGDPRIGSEYGILAPQAFIDHYAAHSTLLEQGGKGARFFATPPAAPLVSLVSVPLRMKTRLLGWIAVASFTKQKRFNEGNRKLLSIVGSRAAAAIENARLYEDLRATFQQTIQGLARAIDKMDRYTAGHSERVATYATYLAVRLGLPRGRDRDRAPERADARHRQDRLRDEPEQAGQAHAGRVRDVQAPPDVREGHPRSHQVPPPARPRRAPAPRALGRPRLSARAQGQRRPAHRPHHRRGRHVRRDDERPRVPARAPARGGGRRDRALQLDAVRPRDRAHFPGGPRRLPRRAVRQGPQDSRLSARRGIDAALALVAALFAAPSLTYPLSRDQALYWYVGRRWLAGAVPYRDMVEHKTPLVYAVHAVCIALTGENMWAIRAVEIVATLVLGWLAARLVAAPREPVPEGALGASLLVASVFYYGYLPFQDQAHSELWCILFVAAAVVAARDLRNDTRAALAAGLLFGLAFVAKPPALAFAPLLAAALYVRPGARAARFALLASLGFAVVVGAVVAYFAARGALGAFVDVAVRANGAFALEGRKASSLADWLFRLWKALDWFMPWSWIFLAVGVGAVVRGRMRRDRILARRYALPLAWAACAYLAVFVQLKFYVYQHALFIVPCAMLGATVWPDLVRWLRPPVAAAAFAATVVVTCVALTPRDVWWLRATNTVRFVAGRLSPSELVGSFDNPDWIDLTHALEAGHWVRDHAAPGESFSCAGTTPRSTTSRGGATAAASSGAASSSRRRSSTAATSGSPRTWPTSSGCAPPGS